MVGDWTRKGGPLSAKSCTAVSVVLAARDDVRLVGPAVAALTACLAMLGRPWEIVFADAASHDCTPDIVERIGRADVRVLRTARRTIGGAAREGLLAASSPIVVVIDQALSQSFGDFASLIDAIEPGGFDVAVAVEHGRISRSRLFHHDGRLTRIVALHRERAANLLARHEASAHAAELVHRAERRGLRVAHVPVSHGSVARRSA